MLLDHQTILCVDDDPDDQMLIHETIKEINPNARIATAHNGLESLQYLMNVQSDESLPCLIIMDINMPLLDGKETLARIKKDPRFQKIPVVMFTTSSSQLDQTFCENYTVPFVTKPLRHKGLKEVIESMLQMCD